MAEVSLTAAFSTVPPAEAEEIKRVIVETVQQLGKDDGAFKRAKLVFTESDERCGLAAVLMARAGAAVVATDVVPEAVDLIRVNAALNGVTVDARLGDCYVPVAGDRFDLICTNPPQMPTPPGRARTDPTAAADNGGVDGWEILDRVIRGAPGHLVDGGRLVFTIFAFLGRKTAFAKLEAAGLTPSIVASETQAFPRIGYERLDHIRALDAEATVAAGAPTTVERFVIEGTRASSRQAR